MATGKQTTRRRSAHRNLKKAQQRRFRITFISIGLILILAAGILMFQTGKLTHQQAVYKAQASELQKDIKEEEAKTTELKKKKAEVTSDSYIESEARKRLGLVYKDEILIKQK